MKCIYCNLNLGKDGYCGTDDHSYRLNKFLDIYLTSSAYNKNNYYFNCISPSFNEWELVELSAFGTVAKKIKKFQSTQEMFNFIEKLKILA